MRYLCSFIFTFMFFCLVGYAQTDTLSVNRDTSTQTTKLEDFVGQLNIRQDPRITDLLVRHIQINQRKRGIDGFRLEIYFNSDSKAREHAVKIKNEFNVIFPHIASYLLFQTPNFKVRVGDFRNKSEALKTKAYISSRFPNAFIVKDNIRFPELYPEPVEQTEEQ